MCAASAAFGRDRSGALGARFACGGCTRGKTNSRMDTACRYWRAGGTAAVACQDSSVVCVVVLTPFAALAAAERGVLLVVLAGMVIGRQGRDARERQTARPVAHYH
ncbi:hypothetical protein PAHAL_5G213800 [Panicum hallii]|uniref:Uncharacterized protein n=1 Tax=Panicum hallii TaxID=206008 RepID=A0A2S3HT39_9POAL|nr:hypothetical protein PAHAL_5G213800 [Panicum hallii]